MLEQWTGEIIGKMHIHRISMKELANEAGLHEKYVSAILNCHRESSNAKKLISDALDKLIAQKQSDGEIPGDG